MKAKEIKVTRSEAKYLIEALVGEIGGNLYNDGMPRETPADIVAAWRRQRAEFGTSQFYQDRPHYDADGDRRGIDRAARMLKRLAPLVAA